MFTVFSVPQMKSSFLLGGSRGVSTLFSALLFWGGDLYQLIL